MLESYWILTKLDLILEIAKKNVTFMSNTMESERKQLAKILNFVLWVLCISLRLLRMCTKRVRILRTKHKNRICFFFCITPSSLAKFQQMLHNMVKEKGSKITLNAILIDWKRKFDENNYWKINNFNSNETKFTDFIRFHTVGLLLELGFDIVIHGTIIALFYC